MHEVAQSYARVLGFALIVLLLTACGSAGDFSESETAPQPALRSGADSPVDSKEAAIAAVRTHLSEIISCREAHGRLEQDFSQGMFEARLASAYSLRTQNPVWEVAFAGDLHIPYVIWFVEQSDGTVLASISAATYYESPLHHMCRRD